MDRESCTFTEKDCLGREDFCRRLEAFVGVERHFVEGGLVVSLNAPFGSGKTTFLKMWENDLLGRRKNNSSIPMPIFLNAWEDDYCGDPLVAILSNLTRVVRENKIDTPTEKGAKKFIEAAKEAAWFSLGLMNGIASNTVGIDPVAAGEFAESKKKGRLEQLSEKGALLELFDEKKRALSNLKSAMLECFGDEQIRAYIFVDELDRCRPTYAVEYLEAIKHVFDVRGLAFILAVDKEQFRSSAKTLFGPDIAFDDYYRKFVHRNVSLPYPASHKRATLARKYLTALLETEARASFLSPDRTDQLLDKCHEAFSFFKLTPRQSHEAVRVVAHAMQAPEKGNWNMPHCLVSAFFFMAAASVANGEFFRKVGSGLLSVRELKDILDPVLAGGDAKYSDWWRDILLVGYIKGDRITNTVSEEYESLGLLRDGEHRFKEDYLQNLLIGWGNWSAENGLKLVYDRIEELHTFSN